MSDNNNFELCQSTEDCKKCGENGCNSKQFIANQCIECDSRIDARCIDEPEMLESVTCLGENLDESACYLWKESTYWFILYSF